MALLLDLQRSPSISVTEIPATCDHDNRRHTTENASCSEITSFLDQTRMQVTAAGFEVKAVSGDYQGHAFEPSGSPVMIWELDKRGP